MYQIINMAKVSRTVEMQQKKALAYTLYTENRFEQKLIAEKIGVSENTISKWKKEGAWDNDREEARNGIAKRRKRILSTLDNMLNHIEDREPPNNVPNAKEADSINKLSASIQKLETELSLAHKTEAGKLFINYVQRVHGHAKSVEALDLWNQFIMSQL